MTSVDPAALRVARESAGLTQHQLARLVGVAGGERVSRWERGTSEPRPDIVLRLARTLDLPPLALLDTDPYRPDLRALRLAAGLTTTQAAARAHVAKQTYERWEAGKWKRLPSRENLRGLARGLSVTIAATTAGLERARAQRGDAPEA